MSKEFKTLIFLFGLLIIASCNGNDCVDIAAEKDLKVKMNQEEVDFGYHFTPTSISFAHSISDSLRKEIIVNSYFLENNTKFDSSICENIVIVLLKMYEYQLKNYYIGFELLDYRDDEAMLVLNKHFACFNIDTTGFRIGYQIGQGYYSHMSFDVLDDNLLHSPEIKKIADHIILLEKLSLEVEL